MPRRPATRVQRAAPRRPGPAPQGPGGRPIRRSEGHGPALVIGLAVVVLVGTFLLYSIARNASEGRVDLGNSLFDLGDADDRVRSIDRRGGPLLFQALIGETDIWVNRVDDTWVAFRAAAPGQPRTCSVVYDPARGDFADPCTQVRYPPNGKGLDQFLIEDRRGNLVVDLKTRLTGPGGERILDFEPAGTLLPPP